VGIGPLWPYPVYPAPVAVPVPYGSYAPYGWYGPDPSLPPGWDPGHWETLYGADRRPYRAWVPAHLR